MRGDLEALIKHTEDGVRIVNLGNPGEKGRFTFLGYHLQLPVQGVVIV